MGDVVPDHIDDMVIHLQCNFEEYVSHQYEWSMVEHPEWRAVAKAAAIPCQIAPTQG